MKLPAATGGVSGGHGAALLVVEQLHGLEFATILESLYLAVSTQVHDRCVFQNVTLRPSAAHFFVIDGRLLREC